jgi:uncharacterized protein (TIGR03435 family)
MGLRQAANIEREGCPTKAKRTARSYKTFWLLVAEWTVVIVTSVFAPPSHAQASANAAPSYAVATIKPAKPGEIGNGFMFLPGGRFTSRNQTIKELIAEAYDLRWGVSDQVSGGPGWVNSARFDIQAKAEQPLPAEMEKIPDHYRLMLQALLADRFKLKIHRQTREFRVYALTVAKNGPKLTPSDQPTAPAAENTSYAFGATLPTPQKDHWRGTRRVGRGEVKAMHETSSMLVDFLQSQPESGGLPVIDRTGLHGEYDFTLQWIPENELAHLRDSHLPPPDASWPPLFTALQEQLGLKLESTKGPIDTIVIDSVEMPSDN